MLKDIRQQRGLTQRALAEMTGIHDHLIQKYESGERSTSRMTLKNAIAIADALGADVRELLPDAPPDEAQ